MKRQGEEAHFAQFWCNVSPFRMNTYKSVSKQRTLTPFRINTYEKQGGGGPMDRFAAAPGNESGISAAIRQRFPARGLPLFVSSRTSTNSSARWFTSKRH